MPSQTQSSLDGQTISRMFQKHYDHTMDNVIHSLHKFMQVAREHGLVLNKKKCEVKSNSVKFFGLILRGEAIIVPPGERKKVLEQIHQGHLGTSKCQYRARQCVYWPGINKDIEQQVEACATCQRHRPQEPRQPLKPTPPPE